MLIYIHFAPFGPQGNLDYAQTSSVVSGGVFVSGHVSIAFNLDFDWMAGSLFAHIALREIGHSMGLAHSRVEVSIMWLTLLTAMSFICCTRRCDGHTQNICLTGTKMAQYPR